MLLELAAAAARAAGRLLAERFADAPRGVGRKADRGGLVSDADRAAEARILSVILAARPGDAILAEEGGRRAGTGELVWVVDPLDGTDNHLAGGPHWAVSVACLDAAGRLVGAVHDPLRGETFLARRGGGAWLGERRLAVAAPAAPDGAVLATALSAWSDEWEDDLERIRRAVAAGARVRVSGSAALDLAWVAAGRLHGCFQCGLQPWDTAAGALLVEEAAGVVLELPRTDGEPGIVAAAPRLARRVRALLSSAPRVAGNGGRA